MSSMLFASSRDIRRRHHFTGQEFDRISEIGLFGGYRIELINGDILEMPPMSDAHAQSIHLANYALLPFFPATVATISIQCPMRLGDSRPFPDLAVVEGTPRQVVMHPTSALLVIEVSDATLKFDRTEKAKLYATHGIADYWIINVKAKYIEVRRKPIGADVGDAQYGEMTVFTPNQTISPLSTPQAIIRVADLLP